MSGDYPYFQAVSDLQTKTGQYPLNPILFTIYYVLKGVTWTALHIFFERIHVLGKSLTEQKGPCIVVSNHPNTMIDPLVTVVWMKRIVFFLANYSLFKNTFQNWFFNTFYCIPIQRPQDVGGAPLANKENFRRAEEHLVNGGCLYIAPEGSSYMERQLRPIKTGTARIALGAIQRGKEGMQVTIVPAGLTYSAPDRFRSRVIVNFGHPISTLPYMGIFEKDPYEAVRLLSLEIDKSLRELMVTAADDREEGISKKVEMLLNWDLMPVSRYLSRMQEVVERLASLRRKRARMFDQLEFQLNKYFERLREVKIPDLVVSGRYRHGWLKGTLLALFLPVFLYGLINNLVTSMVPEWIRRNLGLYVGYDSTVKILSGLVLMPVSYFGQTWLVWTVSGSYWYSILYFLSLYPSGIFAWYYSKEWKFFRAWFRFRFELPPGVKGRKGLEVLRRAVFRQLESLAILDGNPKEVV